MALKAIQTRFAGCLFRSRLEARWAVFFDHLKLDWAYEPEGFQLPSGAYYLPDFRVMMRRPVWFEIKPGNESSALFSEFIGNAPCGWAGSVLNDIPDPRHVKATGNYYDDYERPHMLFADGAEGGVAGWDAPYRFCICGQCGEVGYEFDARAERIGCGHDDGSKHYTPNHPRIVAAFAAARSARFEHDQREVYA